jgi:hypothetical protein
MTRLVSALDEGGSAEQVRSLLSTTVHDHGVTTTILLYPPRASVLLLQLELEMPMQSSVTGV